MAAADRRDDPSVGFWLRKAQSYAPVSRARQMRVVERMRRAARRHYDSFRCSMCPQVNAQKASSPLCEACERKYTDEMMGKKEACHEQPA